jgi:hypothetical protein
VLRRVIPVRNFYGMTKPSLHLRLVALLAVLLAICSLTAPPAGAVTGKATWYLKHQWVGNGDDSYHVWGIHDNKYHHVLLNQVDSVCRGGVFFDIGNWSLLKINRTSAGVSTDDQVFTANSSSWVAGNCSDGSYAPIVYAKVTVANWTRANGYQGSDGKTRTIFTAYCNNADGRPCSPSHAIGTYRTEQEESFGYWGSDPGHVMSLWCGSTRYWKVGVLSRDGHVYWFINWNLSGARKRVVD